MNPDFRKAHEFTALWEGGYVNHVNDTGGETNLGVTKAVWEGWCRERGLKVKPMRALTVADVLPLYEARYWPAAAHLPWPLSGVAYDIAVNHGPGNLRVMLESVPAGGSPAERAESLIRAREMFYQAIVQRRPSQRVFLRGWMRRLNAQREWLAKQAAPPRVLLVPKGGGEPVAWDGKPTKYAGTLLDEALISTLRLVYPNPGGPFQYSPGLTVWVRRSGDLVLKHAMNTDVPALPQK